MDGGLESGLLISPAFHGYEDSIARSFETLGVNMRCLTYPDPKEGRLKRAYYFLLKNTRYSNFKRDRELLKLKRLEGLIETFNKDVTGAVKRGDFDVVVVIKGEYLKPETVQRIHEKTRTVLWTYDEIKRLPYTKASLPFYDRIYSFDPTEGGQFGHEVSIDYLPLAHDGSLYDTRDDLSDPPIDISFVGNLQEDRRKTLLRKLIDRVDASVEIWYNAWKWYNPLTVYQYKIRNRQLGKRVHNTFIDHATINEIYNRSKICINIHKSWKVAGSDPAGLNMRTFEIPGAGGFQLVDDVPNVGSLFDVGEEVATYQGLDELVEKVEYYLDADAERERIAQNGYRRAESDHTFDQRIARIIEDLTNLEQDSSKYSA